MGFLILVIFSDSILIFVTHFMKVIGDYVIGIRRRFILPLPGGIYLVYMRARLNFRVYLSTLWCRSRETYFPIDTRPVLMSSK